MLAMPSSRCSETSADQKITKMKSIQIIAVLLCGLLLGNTAFAQTKGVKKETIKVWGNCGMCKAKIEKAAKTAGATKANWNEETGELQVQYKASATSSEKIQAAVAKSGYDTQDVTADGEAYKKLHACCQYTRKPVKE
jgi:periplasmic mercuric ion binding protein